MAAYENHMLDVQKELYLLREKVQEIATDGYVILKMKTFSEYILCNDEVGQLTSDFPLPDL